MNDTDVIINNKRYTLSGYESSEYLQKVASYINNKHIEFKDSFKRLDSDMKNILLEINIADDYFKAIKQIRELEEESDLKSTEIFNLKHEVISTYSKLEETEKKLEELRNQYNEAQKDIVRLQTENKDNKSQK